MLIYFKVGNYKSIKEPVTLDFRAASISEHEDSNVLKIDKQELLRSIMLYGHNASGKSKILDAFIFFKRFITRSAVEKQGKEFIDIDPFRLNEATEKSPSFFEASFLLNQVRYRYGFEADKERIHKEWLLEAKVTKEYPVFLRMGDEFEIDEKRFPNATGLEKRTRQNALFLSVASQWNVAKAEAINHWFDSIYTVHGLRDNLRFKRITIDLLSSPSFSRLVHQFIQKADLGISGLNVEDEPIRYKFFIKDMSESERLFRRDSKTVFALHPKYNDQNEVVGSESFQLDEDESEGTKKYFALIGVLLTALLQGRLVVIDEFDARMHTLLSKAILKLFNSKELSSQAQLLVASHDTALLDKSILRRDQIYFVEKNQYGVTTTTSLVEYKPRKESPYDRNYLEGKYGAIPFIDDLESIIQNG